jgi:sirohydrochlorin ferrochelatase
MSLVEDRRAARRCLSSIADHADDSYIMQRLFAGSSSRASGIDGMTAERLPDRSGIALLLIAHGSRRPEANGDLHELVSSIRARRDYAIVEPAFLELTEPTIACAAQRCVHQGAHDVIMLPYFLSAGVHVLRDLADARARLGEDFPAARFHLAEPLGQHPLLIEIVLQRAGSVEVH